MYVCVSSCVHVRMHVRVLYLDNHVCMYIYVTGPVKINHVSTITSSYSIANIFGSECT